MLKRKWTEQKYILLGFIIPFLIFMFSMLVMQMAPFGEYTLLISDGDAQYIDRITGFRNVFFEGKSYLYSWSQIQGSVPFAFMGVDPFYLLYLLVDDSHVVDMVTIVSALKIACAGGNFAIYLRKAFKRNDISISFFSWCYALMAFSIAYHFLLGFENSVIILPIVLYGAECLLEDDKHYLFFTGALAASFIMDFSFAYMIGIYTFIYFCYRYCMLHKEFVAKKVVSKFVHFFICPFIAFGCSAFVLIPTFTVMAGRDGLFDVNNLGMFLRYHFTDLLAKLFVGSFDNILPGCYPYIYCGILILIMIGYYFLSYAISYKEKLLSFCLLAFMILSLMLNPLYVAWHGFKPPAYFEGRFSFLVSFTMIYIAYRGYERRRTVGKQQIHRVFLIILAAYLLTNRRQYTFLSDNSLLYCIAFIAVYYLLDMIERRGNYPKKKMVALLAVLVCLELSSNTTLTLTTMDNMFHYPLKDEYNESFSRMDDIKEQLKETDPSFYRMEYVKKRGLNDGFGVGFASISHFDSIYNFNVKEKVGQLGLSTGHNWVLYEGSTPIVDALLNIKYVVAKQNDYFGYEQVSKVEDDYIMKNPFTVGIGFMSQSDLNKLDSTGDPIKFQEEILNKISGTSGKRYYMELPIINEGNNNNKQYVMNVVDEKNGGDKIYYAQDTHQAAYFNYEIKTKTDGPCFMTVNSSKYNAFKVSVDEKVVKDGDAQGEKSIYLGYFKEGETLHVRIDQAETDFQFNNIVFRQMDEQVVKECFEKIRANAFKAEMHTETLLKGSVNVTDSQSFLVTSIPYDEGWRIVVDGQIVEPQKVYDAFLGLQLPAGKHTIELRYFPQGLKLSVFASGISVLLLVIIAVRHKKEKRL